MTEVKISLGFIILVKAEKLRGKLLEFPALVLSVYSNQYHCIIVVNHGVVKVSKTEPICLDAFLIRSCNMSGKPSMIRKLD